MADPELADLHQRAVAWRQTRFDALMHQEPFRALFARLLMAPPARPVTPKAARFLHAYARKDRQKTAPPAT